jgi:hypothetical protein
LLNVSGLCIEDTSVLIEIQLNLIQYEKITEKCMYWSFENSGQGHKNFITGSQKFRTESQK